VQLLQGLLDSVAARHAVLPIGHDCWFDEIVQALKDIAENRVSGKPVVTL
jgi:hypothetical protein